MLVKSIATQKLEELVREFQKEVIPALVDFSHSEEVRNLVVSLQGCDKEQIWTATNEFKRQFKGPNYLGIHFANGKFSPVLIEEEGYDDSGIFDRVYLTILEEVKENLPIDGRTFFYLAIGHDWRLADVWDKSQIIGIDTDETLYWIRPNVFLLNQRAQNYKKVQKELQERGLPLKANMILKGSDFVFGYVSPLRDEHLNKKEKFIALFKELPIRFKVRILDYSGVDPDEVRGFRKLIDSYLENQGLLIALSAKDIELCEKYLEGYKRIEVISPQFRVLLHQWQNLEGEYTKRQLLGFWRLTEEPYAYKK